MRCNLAGLARQAAAELRTLERLGKGSQPMFYAYSLEELADNAKEALARGPEGLREFAEFYCLAPVPAAQEPAP